METLTDRETTADGRFRVHTRLLFYDDQEREWLVHDGIVRQGEFQTLPLGSAFADFRVFDLSEPRERRIYTFQGVQHHAVDESTLDRQFLEATHVWTPISPTHPRDAMPGHTSAEPPPPQCDRSQ